MLFFRTNAFGSNIAAACRKQCPSITKELPRSCVILIHCALRIAVKRPDIPIY